MKQGLTLIAVVLDKSSSMNAVRDATQGAFNEFLQDQQRAPGEAELWLTLFDTEVQQRGPWRIADAPPLGSGSNTYEPAGMTALYDAVGRTIDKVGRSLAAKPESERPERVIFVIQTDGEENSSREYTADRVRGMVELQRSTYQWEFLFLGADQDAWEKGALMGVAAANTVAYDNNMVGTRSVLASASSAVTSYRSGGDATFVDNDLRGNTP